MLVRTIDPLRSNILILHCIHQAKGQLTKANQTKVKMENLARELQKVSGLMTCFDFPNRLSYRTTRDYGYALLRNEVHPLCLHRPRRTVNV
jgi:hypothetical protein